jgi:hypothetical protein
VENFSDHAELVIYWQISFGDFLPQSAVLAVWNKKRQKWSSEPGLRGELRASGAEDFCHDLQSPAVGAKRQKR